MRPNVLLQLLSNSKQLAPVLRGLDVDLPSDARAKVATHSNANATTSIIPWSRADQTAAQAQLVAEWQDINAKLAKFDENKGPKIRGQARFKGKESKGKERGQAPQKKRGRLHKSARVP